MNTKRQLAIFFILLLLFAGLTFVTLRFFPAQPIPGQEMPAQPIGATQPVGALIYTGVVFVIYSLLGLAGYGLARKLGLPGIYRVVAGWKEWFVIPLALGVVCGIALIVLDQVFARIGHFPGFAHPEFPLSIIASATAGIGEEVLLRMFVFGLWAFILNLILRRWNGKNAALWIANVIAALAFGASHLPSVMILTGATSINQIPPLVIAEVFLLNGLVGLVAGWQYIRNGLVAASGVHFWTDIVWHVVWPLLGGL